MASIFLSDPDRYSPPRQDPSKHLISVKHLTGAYRMLKVQQHCHREFRLLGILSHPDFQEFFLIYLGDIYVFFFFTMTDWLEARFIRRHLCGGQRVNVGSLCCSRLFSLSTMWVPRIELKSSSLMVSPSATEPSHQPWDSYFYAAVV